MKYEWFIGLRYLKAKRKQTFISIITVISIAGVMVGVMALIIVLSVMSGFEKTLKEKILGTQAHLVVLKTSQEGMDQYDEVIRKTGEVKGVLAAAPFIFSQVMLSSGSSVSGVVLKGIDPDREGKVTELANNLKAGRLQDLKEAKAGELPGIILGEELAKHLSVSPGDSLQVISPLGHDDAHGNDAQDEDGFGWWGFSIPGCMSTTTPWLMSPSKAPRNFSGWESSGHRD